MDARTNKGKWSLFIFICNLGRSQMDVSHRANGYIRESWYHIAKMIERSTVTILLNPDIVTKQFDAAILKHI